VNTKGSNSFLDYYSTVDGYIKYISVAGLGFIPDKLSLNSVIFVSSIGGVSAAS
jgi:hypothetical protein